MDDTIFALSSGSAPAAIAIIRISGPRAREALLALAGRLPAPRRATAAKLRDPSTGELLDRALILNLVGPHTATGEDVVELHLHGGRAVIARVEQTLAGLFGYRRAQPGEFTRRAFVHGRIDLAEAEGLADLLAAETELQRQAAQNMASGALSRRAESWRGRLLELAAAVEMVLDFADEEDTAQLPPTFGLSCRDLADEIACATQVPPVELLRDGFTIVLAGPPNCGKSTLFNALTGSEAAITSPMAGTTRDLIVRSVALEGAPFRFIDTAGLWQGSHDEIERVGMERALGAAASADLVLWLGDHGAAPSGPIVWEVAPRQDSPEAELKPQPCYPVSAHTGEGLGALRRGLIEHARAALPRPGELAVNQRQRRLLAGAAEGLASAAEVSDLLLVGEHLRAARANLDALLGRSGTEEMLDALFARFCVGK